MLCFLDALLRVKVKQFLDKDIRRTLLEKQKSRIYLETDRLKLILSEHKDEIGNRVIDGIEKVIAAIAFWIPMAISDFSKWKTAGVIIQVILVILGIGYTCYGIYYTYQAVKNPFDKNKLYEEIEEENLMKEHPHSIVLIKDTFHSNDNRFLLYYDARWDCKLFLNYATITSDLAQDEKNITKHLQMELKISQDNLEGAFAFEIVHEKYSVSAKENRCYRHRFYQFLIKEFNKNIEQDSFEIDGKKFYWMSIAEMEQDKRIMEVNSDIVSMVKKVA